MPHFFVEVPGPTFPTRYLLFSCRVHSHPHRDQDVGDHHPDCEPEWLHVLSFPLSLLYCSGISSFLLASAVRLEIFPSYSGMLPKTEVTGAEFICVFCCQMSPKPAIAALIVFGIAG